MVCISRWVLISVVQCVMEIKTMFVHIAHGRIEVEGFVGASLVSVLKQEVKHAPTQMLLCSRQTFEGWTETSELLRASSLTDDFVFVLISQTFRGNLVSSSIFRSKCRRPTELLIKFQASEFSDKNFFSFVIARRTRNKQVKMLFATFCGINVNLVSAGIAIGILDIFSMICDLVIEFEYFFNSKSNRLISWTFSIEVLMTKLDSSNYVLVVLFALGIVIASILIYGAAKVTATLWNLKLLTIDLNRRWTLQWFYSGLQQVLFDCC